MFWRPRPVIIFGADATRVWFSFDFNNPEKTHKSDSVRFFPSSGSSGATISKQFASKLKMSVCLPIWSGTLSSDSNILLKSEIADVRRGNVTQRFSKWFPMMDPWTARSASWTEVLVNLRPDHWFYWARESTIFEAIFENQPESDFAKAPIILSKLNIKGYRLTGEP